VAAHIVNLCWNGLTGMEASPHLSTPIVEGAILGTVESPTNTTNTTKENNA
jgi:hypothetical protein